MLVLKGLVGLQRTVQLQLFSVTGWGTDLDYCDTEWFALEMNRDHSVIFEILRFVYWPSILTKRGLLEKGMANHFSILALRTP